MSTTDAPTTTELPPAQSDDSDDELEAFMLALIARFERETAAIRAGL